MNLECELREKNLFNEVPSSEVTRKTNNMTAMIPNNCDRNQQAQKKFHLFPLSLPGRRPKNETKRGEKEFN